MIRAKLFLVLIAMGIFGVLLVQRPLPHGDLYSNIPAGKTLFLDDLTPTELAETKLQHGLLVPPYDIGVFGTSRNVNINAKDLGIPGRSFFNFAVPGGASIRWSIHMLEQLSLAGHAPRTAVLMFDHAELQVYGNPWLSPLPERWRFAIKDVETGLNNPRVPAKEVLRMVWRYAFQEFQTFKRAFSWLLLKRGILYYLGLGDGYGRLAEEEEVGYLRDGSRPLPADPNATTKVIKRGPPSVMLGYFSADMERLAAVARRGSRIIIYESPLHPLSAAHYQKSISSAAKQTRERFLAECQRLALECHLAPPAHVFVDDEAWRDATHPPVRLLSTYVRSLIAK